MSLYLERRRQNKTKCKTKQLKNNINKTAINIYFLGKFFFLDSSARTSCSIVFSSFLTWSHFLLSPFPLAIHVKWSFFSKPNALHIFLLHHWNSLVSFQLLHQIFDVWGNMLSFFSVFYFYLFLVLIITIGCII